MLQGFEAVHIQEFEIVFDQFFEHPRRNLLQIQLVRHVGGAVNRFDVFQELVRQLEFIFVRIEDPVYALLRELAACLLPLLGFLEKFLFRNVCFCLVNFDLSQQPFGLVLLLLLDVLHSLLNYE